MKTAIQLAAAALLASSGVAWGANTASDTLSIGATAPKLCFLTVPGGSSDLSIADIDETDEDGRANAIASSFTYGDAYCNQSHIISMTVTKMTVQGVPTPATMMAGSDSFATEIHFTGSLENWHSSAGTLSASTDGAPPTGSAFVTGAFRNDAQTTADNGSAFDSAGMKITLTTHETTDPLLQTPPATRCPSPPRHLRSVF